MKIVSNEFHRSLTHNDEYGREVTTEHASAVVDAIGRAAAGSDKVTLRALAEAAVKADGTLVEPNRLAAHAFVEWLNAGAHALTVQPYLSQQEIAQLKEVPLSTAKIASRIFTGMSHDEMMRYLEGSAQTNAASNAMLSLLKRETVTLSELSSTLKALFPSASNSGTALPFTVFTMVRNGEIDLIAVKPGVKEALGAAFA